VRAPAAAIEGLTVLTDEDDASAPSRAAARIIPANAFILKRLTQKHKDMITLSLQGLSREKVGEYCGCTPQYVTMINKQPLARAYIADIEQHLDMRLRGMYEKSITTIENVMVNGRKDTDRLAAAALQLDAIGKRKLDGDEGKETAEDVVAAMLVQGENVQINVNTRR